MASPHSKKGSHCFGNRVWKTMGTFGEFPDDSFDPKARAAYGCSAFNGDLPDDCRRKHQSMGNGNRTNLHPDLNEQDL